MDRAALVAACRVVFEAPRDADGWMLDPEAVERELDAVLCASWDGEGEPDLFEASGRAGVHRDKNGRRYCLDDKGRRTKCTPELLQKSGEQDQQQDDGGKGSSDKPEAKPKSKAPKPEKMTPERAAEHLQALRSKGTVEADDLRALAETLAGLTVPQIKALKEQHGIAGKVTGRKAELVQGIAAAALQAVKSGEASKPTDALAKSRDAFQELRQGNATPEQAQAFLKGVAKLKAGDVKALASEISGAKVATKAMGLRVLADSLGLQQGEAGPAPEKPPEAAKSSPAEPQASAKPEQVQATVRDAVASLVKSNPSGLADVPQVRAAVRKAHGDAAADGKAFDDLVLDLWRKGELNILPIDDSRKATRQELADAIPGRPDPHHGTPTYLFHLEPKGPKTEPQKKAAGVPDVDAASVERDLVALNRPDPRTGLRPMIPDLADALKKAHPGLTDERFHAVLADMAGRGVATLQAFQNTGRATPGDPHGVKAVSGHGPERFPAHPRHGGPAAWVQTPDAAGAEPEKPAPAPAKTTVSGEAAKLSAALSSAPGLSDGQKREYLGHAQAVLSRMSPKALGRFSAHLHEPAVFVADTGKVREALTELYRDSPKVAAQLAGVKGEIGGCYAKHKGRSRLVLDGGMSEASRARAAKNDLKTARGIYAHEFSHAVDGPAHELSGSPEWQAAWKAEMSTRRLNRYSATQPSEGFAEFGRLLLAGEHDPAAVKKHFPQCFAYWESQGLLPAPSGGAAGGTPGLDDLFSGRVDLEDGHHADVLARTAGEQPAPEKVPASPAALASAWASLPGASSNQVSLADLKDALKLDTASLHSLVNDLRKKGILFGEQLEGRGYSPKDRERVLGAAADDGAGGRIAYVGVRPERMAEFKGLAGGEAPSRPEPDAKQAGPVDASLESVKDIYRTALDPQRTPESIRADVANAARGLTVQQVKELARNFGMSNTAGGREGMLGRIADKIVNRKGAYERSSYGPMGSDAGVVTDRADPSDTRPARPDYASIATPVGRHDARMRHESEVQGWIARQSLNRSLRQQKFSGTDKLGRTWKAGELQSHHGGKGLPVNVPAWDIGDARPPEELETFKGSGGAAPEPVEAAKAFDAEPDGPHVKGHAEGLRLVQDAYRRALDPGTTQDGIRATVARLGRLGTADMREVLKGFGIHAAARNRDDAMRKIAQKILDRKGASERANI